jgi:hypothetical protein
VNTGQRPIAEQERPNRVSEGIADGHRFVMISGFPSRAMAKAYYAWLSTEDGWAAMHEAFGAWCDVNGVE